MRTANLNVVNMICLNDRNDRLVNVVRIAVYAIASSCLRFWGFLAGSKRQASLAAAMRATKLPTLPGATGGKGHAWHTTAVREQRGQGSSERSIMSLITSA